MKTAQTFKLSDVFQENGYLMTNGPFICVIKKKSYSGVVGFFLSVLIGVILVTVGLRIGLHFTTVLSGLFFIGFPILYDRWRYPNKIIIDHEHNELKLICGFTYTQTFRISDITGLNVDEAILSSDTSPFKDGYQDFIYSFGLNIANTKVRFVKFLFRKQSETTVAEIFKYLSNQLQLQKTS